MLICHGAHKLAQENGKYQMKFLIVTLICLMLVPFYLLVLLLNHLDC